MINRKGCNGFLCVTEKEGKRVNYRRDRDRERKCVRGRVSEEREGTSVKKDQHININTTKMLSDKQDK